MTTTTRRQAPMICPSVALSTSRSVSRRRDSDAGSSFIESSTKRAPKKSARPFPDEVRSACVMSVYRWPLTKARPLPSTPSMFQPHQTRRTCTCCPYKKQHIRVEQRRQRLLALDMILQHMQDVLVAFTHLRLSRPKKACSHISFLPKYYCHGSFILSLLATHVHSQHYYFESDTISFSSF
jgi:hypothetical protein